MKEQVRNALIHTLLKERMEFEFSDLALTASSEAIFGPKKTKVKEKAKDELKGLEKEVLDPKSPWHKLTRPFREEFIFEFGNPQQVRTAAEESTDRMIENGMYNSRYRDTVIDMKLAYSAAYSDNQRVLDKLTEIAGQEGINRAMQKDSRNKAYRMVFPEPKDYIEFKIKVYKAAKDQSAQHRILCNDEIQVGDKTISLSAVTELVKKALPRMSEWVDTTLLSVIRREVKEIYGVSLTTRWKPEGI